MANPPPGTHRKESCGAGEEGQAPVAWPSLKQQKPFQGLRWGAEREGEDVSCGRRRKKMNENERAGKREGKVSQTKKETETGACPEKAT